MITQAAFQTNEEVCSCIPNPTIQESLYNSRHGYKTGKNEIQALMIGIYHILILQMLNQLGGMFYMNCLLSLPKNGQKAKLARIEWVLKAPNYTRIQFQKKTWES